MVILWLVEYKRAAQKPVVAPVEHTETIDLAADTLFKFDGSSLNDLLPKGRQEVQAIRSIKNFKRFVSASTRSYWSVIRIVSGVKMITKNLVRIVLKLYVVCLFKMAYPQILSRWQVQGRINQSRTAVLMVKSREALKACLQPDRRVTVQITGITK